MAVVKSPAMSMEASGNLGSINYTRWRGLQIARTTYVYTDPETTKQVAQRSLLTILSPKWGDTLSAEQRERWNERAVDEVFKDKLGGVYRPSGYQYFMKLNLQAVSLGYPANNDPPLKPEAVYVDKAEAYWHDAGASMIIVMRKASGVPVDAKGFQVFKAGPYNSGGRRPIKPEYRYFGQEDTENYLWDPDTISQKYYWYKIRWFFETGYVGNWWGNQAQNLT